MKAIILAAGYATRLYPLTIDRPKALLPIQNRPIIDYIMDHIGTISSVDHVYVVSNHKFANHFYRWAERTDSCSPITVIDDGTTTDENKLGAIGDICYSICREKLDDELLILAGDNLFTFSLLEYYNYFKKMDRDCVCVKELNDVEQLKQFAVADLDGNGRIVRLVEKPFEPTSNIAVYATYMYKKETIPMFKQYLDEGNKPDAPGYFVQWLYRKKDVYAFKIDGECYDIGTPKAYEDAQKYNL